MNTRKSKRTIAAGLCALVVMQVVSSGCGRDPNGSTAGGGQAEVVVTHGTDGVVRIPVTREQVARFGIMIAPATAGTLIRSLRVLGEITLDSDRVVLVVPPAPGIVRKVERTIGDRVGEGEILAWIESTELASAKAAYRAAVTIHARETALRASAINSVQDLLEAETSLVQAQAILQALLGGAVSVDALRAYAEAVDAPEMDALHAAVETRPQERGVAEKRLGWYALRAPFSGTVVERQIAPGAAVDTAACVFTIADLSRVWAEVALGQDNIADVHVGQVMRIGLRARAPLETTVQYVSPLVDAQTRTVTVRGTLDNQGGGFRPGSFIEGEIQIPADREAVLVPRDAIQLVYDHTCVFVWNAGAFELREVQTGMTDGRQVEVLRGLQAGERVAAVNAFHLKAELIKSAAGDMGAGHGHAH
jgi:membrane fusion protein, heavy metal efflux system